MTGLIERGFASLENRPRQTPVAAAFTSRLQAEAYAQSRHRNGDAHSIAS